MRKIIGHLPSLEAAKKITVEENKWAIMKARIKYWLQDTKIVNINCKNKELTLEVVKTITDETLRGIISDYPHCNPTDHTQVISVIDEEDSWMADEILYL